MKQSQHTTTLFRLGLLPTLGVLSILTPSALSAFNNGGDAICSQTAAALRRASQREAHASFALSVANCLNDTGDPFEECFKDALAELQDAMDLLEEQYQGRLDVCAQIGEAAYDPNLDEDDFDADVDNDYFPLIPGQTKIFEKMTSDGLEQVVVTTLAGQVEIDDIECVAVSDVVTLDGEFVEDTIDWFSQHENGDVWYMGEISKNYEEGFLNDLDGSWRAGVEQAEPGIVMLDDPRVGDIYRQEFFLNEAEDMAIVIDTDVTVSVPAGTFHHCIETEDWTPLEPDSFERKFYAPGVGNVLNVNLATGERTELVQIIN